MVVNNIDDNDFTLHSSLCGLLSSSPDERKCPQQTSHATVTCHGLLAVRLQQSQGCPVTSGRDPAFTDSCGDWKTEGGKSGVYFIQLVKYRENLRVCCDMDSGSGGWLVFQRRTNGSVDFDRNWTQYEQGFGDITGEFWLGLSKLHTLTKGRPTRLRVDLGEVNGHRHYAEYSTFRVGGPETNYRLTVSGYSGNAVDSLQLHNNQSFSTFDRDNDKWSNSGNCAVDHHGAWGYNSCHFTNLNGRYKADGARGPDGVNWFYIHNDRRSFNFSEMKVQPV
ncbi:ficolin-1-like [Pomacea canaliculata]|uniref:ficolin-1-like n=1 Tax=Pomacea canaliculata TaxID=400727 RepID=UPI000D73B669|nr:ficolin-1-like [Pomacea canaliculata]